MIKISELKEYAGKYKGFGISGFIDFIEQEQGKNKKAGVVSLEQRETTRRLKEIEDRQKEKKGIDPEEDFNNL